MSILDMRFFLCTLVLFAKIGLALCGMDHGTLNNSSQIQENFNASSALEQNETCITESGQDVGKPCLFPFEYKGILFSECPRVANDDKSWCSTDNHDNGTSRNWGYCGLNCPMEEGMNFNYRSLLLS